MLKSETADWPQLCCSAAVNGEKNTHSHSLLEPPESCDLCDGLWIEYWKLITKHRLLQWILGNSEVVQVLMCGDYDAVHTCVFVYAINLFYFRNPFGNLQIRNNNTPKNSLQIIPCLADNAKKV